MYRLGIEYARLDTTSSISCHRLIREWSRLLLRTPLVSLPPPTTYLSIVSSMMGLIVVRTHHHGTSSSGFAVAWPTRDDMEEYRYGPTVSIRRRLMTLVLSLKVVGVHMPAHTCIQPYLEARLNMVDGRSIAVSSQKPPSSCS